MLQLFSKRGKKPVDKEYHTMGSKSLRSLPPLPNTSYRKTALAQPLDTLTSEEGSECVYSRLRHPDTSLESAEGLIDGTYANKVEYAQMTDSTTVGYAEARSAETDFEDADDTASSIYCKAKKEDASSDSWAEGPVYERAGKGTPDEPIYSRIVKKKGTGPRV
eukprot:m.48391 g.48391  ORF g.48391 m.48391 type:complete len:163 (+) comp15847_c2_seq3:72-560(+)